MPQQRWWDGLRWTHDVSPIRQDLSQLPAPQPGSYGSPQAIPAPQQALPAVAVQATTAQPTVESPALTAAATRASTGATAATETVYPTRRQLRQRQLEEDARRAAEAAAAPHPAAPFAMPAGAPVAAAPVTAAPVLAAPVIAAPVIAEPVPAAPALAAPAPMAPAAASFVMPEPVSAAHVVYETAPVSQPVAIPTPRAPQLSLPASISATVTPPSASWPFQATGSTGPTGSTSLASVEDSSTGVPYQPFGMIPKITAGQAAPPDRTETVSVWLIAVLPLVMVGVGLLVVTQIPDFYSRFMQGGLLFIFALATIALAVRDRRELVSAGHQSPAHPAWILLTPFAYLIARSVSVHRQTGRGTAPLWVWLVVVAAVTAAALLLPEWLERFVTTASLF